MAFARPTLLELVDRITGDFVSRLGLAGAVLRRSRVYVFARAQAGAAHGLHGHLDFLSKQLFPQTVSAEYLDDRAAPFGVTRKPASFAIGNVTFTGTDGAVIPEGTVLQRADEAQYETVDEAVIASGTATVAVIARAAGLSGNAAEAVALSLISPLAGVSAQAAVASGGLTGGADQESDDSLRERLIERMQAPPLGGAAHDYVRWAKEVTGVTRVWVSPLELGDGTVVVRFTVDDHPTSIIPDAAKLQEVQDHIDTVRPVTAQVTVYAPAAVALDFDITLTPATAAVKAAVEAELKDLLKRDAAPGGTILLSRIREAVSIAAGESDNIVNAPAANVTHNPGEIAVMGTITWG